MSTHEAKVLRIDKIDPHPDPETINLGLVRVWDYQVVVNKHQWKVSDLAAYVEPDTIVDGSLPEFSFLNKEGKPPTKHRIKVRRIRGIWSEGLLIPAPEGFEEGSDVWEHLKLERYVPKMKRRFGPKANLDSDWRTSGRWEKSPISLPFGKYDIQNWKKWNKIFETPKKDWLSRIRKIFRIQDTPCEIFITEKLHGANAKYAFINGRFYCGSRGGWKVEDEKCIWWQALRQNEWMKPFLMDHPGDVLFGEVFGQVQDLKYGAKKNQIFFRAFDIFLSKERQWMDAKRFDKLLKEDQKAPVLYRGPYSKEIILQMTDGLSKISGADHAREGCVIRPVNERIHPKIGRVILKNVSNEYLLRS